MTMAADEQEQNFERASADRHRLAVGQELTLLDQQAEWSKREHLDHRHCHGQCVRSSRPVGLIANNLRTKSFAPSASALPSTAGFIFYRYGPAASVASVGTNNSLLCQSDAARLGVRLQFIS
jgi:hypothetical protein